MLKKLVICLIPLLFACSQLTTSPSEEDSTPVGWQVYAPGMEYRKMIAVPSTGVDFEMHVARFDPAQVDFRVIYQPGEAFSFTDWHSQLQSQAIAFVNGGFFTEELNALGLVVTDGVPFGSSYIGYGGMFQVDQQGKSRVRSLVQEPYNGEIFRQSLQSFPMLIESGGLPASTGEGFDDIARRTVIAQDRNGFILLITTGLLGEISFNDLQKWLLDSDLNLDVAFALDGGKSTAMYIANQQGGSAILVPSFSPFPVALVVYRNR